MAVDIEVKTIKKFIIKDKQERYLTLISASNKRKKFINELAHFSHLKPGCFEHLKGVTISELILRIGAYKDCYVISENNTIDAKRIDTLKALNLTLGYGMGTLL